MAAPVPEDMGGGPCSKRQKIDEDEAWWYGQPKNQQLQEDPSWWHSGAKEEAYAGWWQQGEDTAKEESYMDEWPEEDPAAKQESYVGGWQQGQDAESYARGWQQGEDAAGGDDNYVGGWQVDTAGYDGRKGYGYGKHRPTATAATAASGKVAAEAASSGEVARMEVVGGRGGLEATATTRAGATWTLGGRCSRLDLDASVLGLVEVGNGVQRRPWCARWRLWRIA